MERRYHKEEANIQTGLERIAVVEERINHVIDTLEKMADAHQKTQEALDDILELKHKGMGAFWVAASLFGSGLISLVYMAVDWVKGLGHA